MCSFKFCFIDYLVLILNFKIKILHMIKISHKANSGSGNKIVARGGVHVVQLKFKKIMIMELVLIHYY